MDAERFDNLARNLLAAASRRDIARALAGIALAGSLGAPFGLGGMDAKKRRKKKKHKRKNRATCTPNCAGKECGSDGCGGSCGSCGDEETCENGSCTPICSLACGPCQHCLSPGVCVTVGDGSACADDGYPCTDNVCISGTCTHPVKADLTDCGGGNQCSGGICATPPTCQGHGASCAPNGLNSQCCSGDCVSGGCDYSDASEQCFTSQDCRNSAPVCLVFVCQ